METCAASAFMRFSTKVLMATGESRCADAIENSLYNAHFAAQLPDGSEYMITVPISGARGDIRGHMTCCPAWGLTGMSSIRDWAAGVVTGKAPAIAVNYYGACSIEATLGSDLVTIQQDTTYPAAPEVRMVVQIPRQKTFPIWLRIPAWSKATRVWVNDKELPQPEPGRYLKLERAWKPHDEVRLLLDFAVRLVQGCEAAQGYVAAFKGPLLLAVDERFNPGIDMGALPKLNAAEVRELAPTSDAAGAKPPWMLVRLITKDGRHITLCDYANAGADKAKYQSWLPAE
jgi:hypothetical protein